MLKEYPEYKGSIALWDKKYPSHWKDLRGKTLFNNPKVINKNNEWNNVLSLTLRGVVNNDIDNPLGLVPKDYNTYQLFKKDDLVFKLIDLQNISTSRVGLVHEDGIMSPAYIRLELKNEKKDDVNIRFVYLYYYSLWLRTIFNSLGDGVRQTLAAPDLLNLTIPIPPISEQNAIVKYLDYKNKQIDEFVSAKEKEIEELKELKESVIVTYSLKGLIENREMITSQFPWIGEYPKGWRETRLKNVATKLNHKVMPNAELLVCSNSGNVNKRGDSKLGLVAASDDIYQGVREGDLLIHGMDTWHGAIAISNYNGMCTPVVHVCDSHENKRYLAYYLRSLAFLKVYKKITNGVRENTSDFRSWDKAGTINMLIPPIEEQNAIVEYLDKKTYEIDTLITSIQKQITLVKELRAKIITDVVTGKIDVREGVK